MSDMEGARWSPAETALREAIRNFGDVDLYEVAARWLPMLFIEMDRFRSVCAWRLVNWDDVLPEHGTVLVWHENENDGEPYLARRDARYKLFIDADGMPSEPCTGRRC